VIASPFHGLAAQSRHKGMPEILKSSRVAMEPIDRVVLMENHDNAYHTWKQAGVKRRILLHFDAHHDMWWISEHQSVTIANFICPALLDDTVREIYWVVPDRSWNLPKSRKSILRHLKQIKKRYPNSSDPIQIGNSRVRTEVFGKPLTVCSVDGLPAIDEPVLLDIDVDWLVIPYVSYGEIDHHEVLPWCWPDELAARLSNRCVRTDLVTIAYSVEGGYTPLNWKYLGDEIALRLRHPAAGGAALESMTRIREGSQSAFAGNNASAAKSYHEAACIVPKIGRAHV
jgi:hypothetical protein